MTYGQGITLPLYYMFVPFASPFELISVFVMFPSS